MTGQVTDVTIPMDVTPAINEEVKRAMLSSPLWKPAAQAGVNVARQFTIPVVFYLP